MKIMSWFWTSGELWDNSEPMYLPSPDPFEHTNETLLTANEQKTGNNDHQPLFLHFTAMFTFAFVFLFWKGIDQSALLLTIFSDVKFVYIYGAVHRFLLWVNRMFTFGFESGITIEGEKLRINFLSSIGGNYGLIHLVRN